MWQELVRGVDADILTFPVDSLLRVKEFKECFRGLPFGWNFD